MIVALLLNEHIENVINHRDNPDSELAQSRLRNSTYSLITKLVR